MSESQRFFFLESLKQVQAGGDQLRRAGLSQADLVASLELLDGGLQLAFQVERGFLDELDIRLGKNYQRWFVAGVENYRIGIEAGDEEQQRKGLQLLSQWSSFWGAEQQAIMQQLQPD